MNPEDRARQDIDRQLGQCGWVVQDKGQMNISAALGVAVREFPMLTGGLETGTQLVIDSSCVPVSARSSPFLLASCVSVSARKCGRTQIPDWSQVA